MFIGIKASCLFSRNTYNAHREIMDIFSRGYIIVIIGVEIVRIAVDRVKGILVFLIWAEGDIYIVAPVQVVEVDIVEPKLLELIIGVFIGVELICEIIHLELHHGRVGGVVAVCRLKQRYLRFGYVVHYDVLYVPDEGGEHGQVVTAGVVQDQRNSHFQKLGQSRLYLCVFLIGEGCAVIGSIELHSQV